MRISFYHHIYVDHHIQIWPTSLGWSINSNAACNPSWPHVNVTIIETNSFVRYLDLLPWKILLELQTLSNRLWYACHGVIFMGNMWSPQSPNQPFHHTYDKGSLVFSSMRVAPTPHRWDTKRETIISIYTHIYLIVRWLSNICRSDHKSTILD